MEIDRRVFLASLGGAAAVQAMSPDQRADALEHHMVQQLDRQPPGGQSTGPATASSSEPKIARGTGSLFVSGRNTSGGNSSDMEPKFEPMPERPTLIDYFRLRFWPARHVLQSANRALKEGQPERTVFACLLHDVVLNLIKPDHGYWGAQLFAPYVDERVSWGIKYHQALRFYPDLSVGYEYPEMYHRIFGRDYVPDPYIKADYEFAKKHKWYMEARLITVNDLYAFDPNMEVSLDPFVEIVGRNFRQPREGLGYDNSPSAHMWRTIADPNRPL